MKCIKCKNDVEELTTIYNKGTGRCNHHKPPKIIMENVCDVCAAEYCKKSNRKKWILSFILHLSPFLLLLPILYLS